MSYRLRDQQKPKNCPQCKNDLGGMDTYQCGCQYMICYSCYEYQKKNEGYCPNCEKDYLSRREDKKNYNNKNNGNYVNNNNNNNKKNTDIKYQKYSQKNQYKQKPQDLSQVRIIKKNLVYCIGISPQIASEDILSKNEYFGQYGKITKIVVNKQYVYNPNSKTPSYSAFITYSNEKEASLAVLAIEEFQINDRLIRASYGTTKYCTSFLKNQECANQNECLYLHSYGEDRDSYAKDEILSNKGIFYEQQKIAIKAIKKFIPEFIKSKVKLELENTKSMLPHPSTVLPKLVEHQEIDQKTMEQMIAQEKQKYQKKKNSDDKQGSVKAVVQTNSISNPLVDQWDTEIPKVVNNENSDANNKDKSDLQENINNINDQQQGQNQNNNSSDNIVQLQNKNFYLNGNNQNGINNQQNSNFLNESSAQKSQISNNDSLEKNLIIKNLFSDELSIENKNKNNNKSSNNNSNINSNNNLNEKQSSQNNYLFAPYNNNIQNLNNNGPNILYEQFFNNNDTQNKQSATQQYNIQKEEDDLINGIQNLNGSNLYGINYSLNNLNNNNKPTSSRFAFAQGNNEKQQIENKQHINQIFQQDSDQALQVNNNQIFENKLFYQE